MMCYCLKVRKWKLFTRNTEKSDTRCERWKDVMQIKTQTEQINHTQMIGRFTQHFSAHSLNIQSIFSCFPYSIHETLDWCVSNTSPTSLLLLFFVKFHSHLMYRVRYSHFADATANHFTITTYHFARGFMNLF